MKLFGGKKKDTNVPSEPGAHYVQAGENLENLPVATPIEATVVASSPYASSPAKTKGESVTRTTVYPPDAKQPYATNTTQLMQPQTQTFVTTIPAPANYNRGSNNNNAQTIAQQEEQLMSNHLRRAPIKMSCCPSCSQSTRTRVRTWPNIVTWVACVVLLILFWPICWIPLVCDVFKQTDHFCSKCGTKVGDVYPFQDCCEKRR